MLEEGSQEGEERVLQGRLTLWPTWEKGTGLLQRQRRRREDENIVEGSLCRELQWACRVSLGLDSRANRVNGLEFKARACTFPWPRGSLQVVKARGCFTNQF